MTARRTHIVLLTTLTFLLLTTLVASAIWYKTTSNATQEHTCMSSGTVTSTPGHNSPPPLYLGLDAYRHWDKLSYLEFGDRVSGQSTADPGGSNADNKQLLRVLTDGEHVLFDQTGPGVVTFMRMQENYGGPWHLSLDGHVMTTIGANDLGQMHPTSDPASAFPYPLSLNRQESQ